MTHPRAPYVTPRLIIINSILLTPALCHQTERSLTLESTGCTCRPDCSAWPIADTRHVSVQWACPRKQTWPAEQKTTTDRDQGNALGSQVSPVTKVGHCLGSLPAAALFTNLVTFNLPLKLAPICRAPVNVTAAPVGDLQMDLHLEPQPLPGVVTEADDTSLSTGRARDGLAGWGLTPAHQLSQAVCPPLWDTACLPGGSFLCPSTP